MKKNESPLPPELDQFWQEREELNKIVLEMADLPIKRFFSLDGQTYRSGALPVQTKELLGLVASTVLRCDDCIRYHIVQCFRAGVTTEEFTEAMGVALIVGGSITIPHVRRAFRAWKTLVETHPGDPK